MNTNLFRQLLRSAPDFIQEQVNFWISMAEDAIRSDDPELQKITSWLRRIGKPQLADAIERGEYRHDR